MKATPGRGTPDVSTWGSVRRWEAATRYRLRTRRKLWLHGWCIGLLVVAFMWAAAHLQMLLLTNSLAVRYLVTLGVGYLGFLLLLRWWAGALVGERDAGLAADVASHVAVNMPVDVRAIDAVPDVASTVEAGGGGDYGGGGAEASFDGLPEVGSDLGDSAGSALDAVSVADAGDVVSVPVAGVFVAALLALAGAGSLLLLYFGFEVLLAVAVEIAFGYVSARTAVRVAREGWLGTAVRLTWKPLLGALLCAVLLGAAIDVFVPQARSLPHAVQILRA